MLPVPASLFASQLLRSVSTLGKEAPESSGWQALFASEEVTKCPAQHNRK